MDRTCKPCTDFYQFAVGGWIKKNSIPVRIRRIVTFRNWPTRIATYARDFEKVSKTSNPPESNLQKIGDYYGSCMDESRIEAAGVVRPPAQRCQIW
ncbi:MAG: hypothetical protein GIW98_03900 [Candidatus Eremiobacteraeota bacterium]|nr:hypothetical protein [Candidatus Eremiobacteraeota bacterium]